MIELTKDIVEQMIGHSKSECPNEACGILGGKGSKVLTIFKMTNTDKSPSSFFMDPKEQLKVMKELRKEDMEMFGIYHSHVASKAYPSQRDIALAFYPDISYLIVSLSDMDNPIICSYKIRDNKIEEEKISYV
ncbi:MAG: M67 family metallopeptidase [Candidatus Omnitrophica bacterium]|nr:M67 family metallopeptidase [Candidatus Omnitrophota bacterium]